MHRRTRDGVTMGSTQLWAASDDIHIVTGSLEVGLGDAWFPTVRTWETVEAESEP